MDKNQLVKEAYDKRKEEGENDFRRQVENLVLDIEEKSSQLKILKQKLVDLEYKEPEIVGDILRK